jgi:integrase
VIAGLRLGELLGLQWGDVDFHGRFVEVRRNLVAGRITTPKSGRSRRVDMSAQLAETLRTLLTSRKAETLRKGWPQVPDWVFCNEEGGPLDGDNLRHRVFYKTLARAGLRRVRFHDLRHSFASLLLQQGESPAYVKEQMGHSSIQVTVDIYGHLIPGANRQAVDRLDDATGRNPGATGKKRRA